MLIFNEGYIALRCHTMLEIMKAYDKALEFENKAGGGEGLINAKLIKIVKFYAFIFFTLIV
jgi:hypothetical protein